jgi:hypothetical protein
MKFRLGAANHLHFATVDGKSKTSAKAYAEWEKIIFPAALGAAEKKYGR